MMRKVILLTLFILGSEYSYSQNLLYKSSEQISAQFGEPNDYWKGLVVYEIQSSDDWLGKYSNRLFIRYAPTNKVWDYTWNFSDRASYENAVNTLRYKSTYVKAIKYHYFYKQGEFGFIATEENGFQIKICSSVDLDLHIARMEGNLDKYRVKTN
ncbi:hypothetical protein [Pontibacter fetidus]|uniref:Uncharacterized protein n=1 Tax=Pontibacter fetidus TaxID=2700082 RepID=A0A6B2H011_9BACT|nr:hypothetical protein [Pontibacter fetidus]NDK56415.1 hypothetical protein [Pontibacter fetidus]